MARTGSAKDIRLPLPLNGFRLVPSATCPKLHEQKLFAFLPHRNHDRLYVHTYISRNSVQVTIVAKIEPYPPHHLP